MAGTNMKSTRVKPLTPRLLTLHALRRERISPSFARVTLGGGDISDFVPMGYDQWFRLFLPVAGGTLDRVPNKLDTFSYLKFLTVSKATRPVLRTYSVRAFRPDGPEGPELDVDFVLHGSAQEGTAGPAATWAQTCSPGDVVGLLDEGTGFSLPDGIRQLRIVADETGLPAAANILAGLPADVGGHVVLEIPEEGDRQELTAPEGFGITWLPRSGRPGVPGELALATAAGLAAPDQPWFGVAIGEQSLATGMRRHWVDQGLPKHRLMFCGYWRHTPQEH